MNIKITLKKNAPESVTININSQPYTLVDQITTISIDQQLPSLLEISRNDIALYNTDRLTHSTYVIVEQILIDNFWGIGDKNHWSKTRYSQEYIQHLDNKPVTWELSKDLYNNTLFFNGSLEYNITTPIRGMFFK